MPRHKTKCEIECYKCNSSDNVYYFRKRDLRNVYKCYTCDFEFHDKKILGALLKELNTKECAATSVIAQITFIILGSLRAVQHISVIVVM